MDAAGVWEIARTRLREELGWLRTQSWLEQVTLRALEGGAACLDVASGDARRCAQEHREALLGAISAAAGRPVTQLRLGAGARGRRSPARALVGAAAPARPGGEQPEPRRGDLAEADEPDEVELEAERLDEQLQLSSFLAGPSNELPLRFALHLLERPGAYNPFVVYGRAGSGKTHLLQGIANAYRRRYPTARVVYASTERFARQFSTSARRRQADRFRALYRRADLLLLDDVEGLSGKGMTQRELALTLDHLHHKNRQVVLSCARPPRRIAHLERVLEERLVGGLVVELLDPDRATLTGIVRGRAAAANLHLEDGVVEMLVTGARSIRELLGALTRLEAHARHVRTPLHPRMAHELLADLLGAGLEPASLEGLASLTARHTGIPVEQLCGRGRKACVAHARQLAMGLSRELTRHTLREIGTFFGGRSVSGVHLAHRKVLGLREQDARVRQLWEDARRCFARSPG